MVTRCKMTCTTKKTAEWQGQREFTFTPVYDADPTSENGKFFTATPSGNLTIGCLNEAVDFEVGKEYFIDITPAI